MQVRRARACCTCAPIFHPPTVTLSLTVFSVILFSSRPDAHEKPGTHAPFRCGWKARSRHACLFSAASLFAPPLRAAGPSGPLRAEPGRPLCPHVRAGATGLLGLPALHRRPLSPLLLLPGPGGGLAPDPGDPPLPLRAGPVRPLPPGLRPSRSPGLLLRRRLPPLPEPHVPLLLPLLSGLRPAVPESHFAGGGPALSGLRPLGHPGGGAVVPGAVRGRLPGLSEGGPALPLSPPRRKGPPQPKS